MHQMNSWAVKIDFRLTVKPFWAISNAHAGPKKARHSAVPSGTVEEPVPPHPILSAADASAAADPRQAW